MSPYRTAFNILIIEDNPADAFLIEEMLRSSSVTTGNIYTADRTAGGIKLLEKYMISLVLVDLSLPDSHGMESFLKIKDITRNIPVIILTGLSDSELAIEALKMGAQDYLVKGEFKADVLVKSIQYSIERKQAEETLLASEEKYRQMFYKNPYPAWIFDPISLDIMEVNDAAIQKYGYQREEFLALTLRDIRPQEDVEELLTWVTDDQLITKGRVWRHKKKNNEILFAEVNSYEIDYHGKTAIQVQINDITEKIRLEDKLAKQQLSKQKQITAAVLNAQEKERKSLGEELHDNINQILATAKLFLSVAINTSNTEHLDSSMEYISTAMEEIRKLSKVLITPTFIESGIKKSINELTQNIEKVKNINFSTTIQLDDELDLSEHLKLAVYRIIQEQLHNILKYAEASSVSISLTENDNSISLIIEDNGKGFDTCQVNKGIGFINMNSRAALYNGKVEVESSPGRGCRLVAQLYKNAVARVA
jgi:two-component system, NarL family, sensor histidine kinase UhpB